MAETEKIEVLNPNELSNELRSEFAQGEKFRLKITAVGQNPKQGVGYLSEGTMVVVENAANKVGKEVELVFEKYIQTASGRMIFAKLGRGGARVAGPNRSRGRKRGSS